jgi:predicted ATPase/DNA-binding SARP family transcriptional activator
MNVTVRLLGRATVRLDDRVWEPPADRRSALLYYLAYAEGWVSRDDLLYLFWPDSEEQKGRANLRQLLVAVRALPFSLDLEVERTRIRWQVATDVGRWRDRLVGDEPIAMEDGWQAPLLDGFRLASAPEFESWLELERASWHERLRTYLHEAAQRSTREGRDDLAAGLLDRWLQAAPLDEEALRAWLQASARLGRTTAALERFAAFERRLAADMQLVPERVTYDMVTALRTTAAVAADAPPLGSVTTTSGVRAYQHARSWRRRALPRRVGFIGRERELERLTELLSAETSPVVTLQGTGGIGKTRLALQAVETLRSRFADGAVVAQLSDAITLDDAASVLATALQLELPPGSDVFEQVENALASRQTLVLLDNVEQLAGISDVVERWRTVAPDVAWLLTSRVRVEISDEAVIELAGLPYPSDANDPDLMNYDAVALLQRRARAVGSDLDPAQQAAAVVRLCRATAGMPLALELAAGWLRVLPLDAIADELEAGLELLDAEDAPVDPRHRTMRMVFDASWAALSERERGALVRLAAFHGGFTGVAASEVADVGRPLLLALRNRSFLSLDPTGRFVQHPLLETYVRERAVADAAAWRVARERHAAWFCALLARCEDMGQAARHREANALLQPEHLNIEAAWAVALEAGWWDALKMGGATLGLSYATIGRPERWGQLLRDALARTPRDTAAWALLEVHESSLDQFQGRVDRADGRRRHAVEVLRRTDDRHGLAWGLFLYAETAQAMGRGFEAEAALMEAGTILRDLDDRHVLGMVLQHLCDQTDDAVERERRYDALFENLADTHNLDHEAVALDSRAAFLAHTYGAYAEALGLADRAVDIERNQDWAPMYLGDRLRTAARIRIATGDLGVAEAQAREALALARTIEGFLPRPVPEAAVLLATVAWLRGDLATAEAYLPPQGRAARTIEGLALRSALACARGDLTLARGCADQALAEAATATVGRDGHRNLASAHAASGAVALAMGEPTAAAHDLGAALDVGLAWRLMPTLLEACSQAIGLLPTPLAADVSAWVVAHPATPFAARRRLSATRGVVAASHEGARAWDETRTMAVSVREALARHGASDRGGGTGPTGG